MLFGDLTDQALDFIHRQGPEGRFRARRHRWRRRRASDDDSFFHPNSPLLLVIAVERPGLAGRATPAAPAGVGP